jgi:hypothetical protein
MKNAVARLAGIAWQIRQPVAAMLSVVLALPAQAETASIRELALGTQIGSTVEVRLAGKDRPNKLRGRMGLLDNQAFDLFVENSCGEPRSIPFEQVKSLRLVKKMRAEPVERSPTQEGTARAIPKGRLVEVRLAGKQTPNWLRGRIGQVSSQGFQIQVFRSGTIDVQALRFAEVESIKSVDSLWVQSAPAKAGRVIGTGVSIALSVVLVLVIVVVIAAKTGHLGG